jgi:hypothetical protein
MRQSDVFQIDNPAPASPGEEDRVRIEGDAVRGARPFEDTGSTPKAFAGEKSKLYRGTGGSVSFATAATLKRIPIQDVCIVALD